MISIIKGKVIFKDVNSIIIENNGIGYSVYVSNVENFIVGENYTILTHLYVKEDEMSLFGFLKKEEKEIFMSLISVKGIGVKSAMQALSKSSSNSIIEAIEMEDFTYLKKLPKIGPKAAQQIVLDLKGKLDFNKIKEAKKLKDPIFAEAKDALKSLNFRVQEIDKALEKIRKDDNLTVDKCVFKALQYLNKS